MATAHVTPAQFKALAAKHVPESDVQAAILEWLAWMKVRAVRIETNGQPVHGPGGSIAGLRTCSHVGTPDILAWLPWGQACAIECKRPGEGKTGLRFSQAAWIRGTHARSKWTMILVAESRLDVEEVLGPLMEGWKENESSRTMFFSDFWHCSS